MLKPNEKTTEDAATHQFGDPERNIPARPFLGVSDEDNRFIVDTLARHIDPDRTGPPIPRVGWSTRCQQQAAGGQEQCTSHPG